MFLRLIFNDQFFFSLNNCVFIAADCQEPWVRPGSSVACYASGGEKGMKWNDAVKVKYGRNDVMSKKAKKIFLKSE